MLPVISPRKTGFKRGHLKIILLVARDEVRRFHCRDRSGDTPDEGRENNSHPHDTAPQPPCCPSSFLAGSTWECPAANVNLLRRFCSQVGSGELYRPKRIGPCAVRVVPAARIQQPRAFLLHNTNAVMCEDGKGTKGCQERRLRRPLSRGAPPRCNRA